MAIIWIVIFSITHTIFICYRIFVFCEWSLFMWFVYWSVKPVILFLLMYMNFLYNKTNVHWHNLQILPYNLSFNNFWALKFYIIQYIDLLLCNLYQNFFSWRNSDPLSRSESYLALSFSPTIKTCFSFLFQTLAHLEFVLIFESSLRKILYKIKKWDCVILFQ